MPVTHEVAGSSPVHPASKNPVRVEKNRNHLKLTTSAKSSNFRKNEPTSAKLPHFSSNFLTVAEVAKTLGKSPDAVTRWCQSGKIAAIPQAYGHKTQWLISPQAIDALKTTTKELETSRKVAVTKPHQDYVTHWLKALRSGTFNGRAFSELTVNDYAYWTALFFKRQSKIGFNSLQIELLRIPAESFAKREHLFKAVLCLGKFLIRENALEEAFLTEIKSLRPKRHLPVKRATLDEQEAVDLLSVCKGVYENALIQTLTTTGLRASELCDLTVDDIDLNEGRLTVRIGKGGKTRKVGLPQRTIDALHTWTRDRAQRFPKAGPWLFVDKDGKQLSRHGLYKRLERLGKLAGVKVSPHALRRAFVTINAGKGRPLVYLQKACGHSDIKTTMGYCLTTEAETVEAMKHW